MPCRGAASPLSWSVPVAGSPSLPALRAAAAAPVAPFRPCPPAFPPVPPAVGLGLCRVAPLQARQAWFFGAAGSPPLRRGVLPPLVLGFALPPFAPPSRGGRRSLRCGFALRPARGSPGPPWGARPAGFGGAGAPCAGAMRGLMPPLFAPRPGAVSPRARARRCLSGLAGGVPLPLWLAGLCSASRGCTVAGGRGAAVRPALRPQEGRLCPYPPRPFPHGERGAQGRWPPLRGVSWGRRVVKGKRPCRGLCPP